MEAPSAKLRSGPTCALVDRVGPGGAGRSEAQLDLVVVCPAAAGRGRIGKKKAAGAVGHSTLVIAWHLLAYDCDHQDLGGDFFVRRDSDRARHRAVAQLQALGYQVTLQPTAA